MKRISSFFTFWYKRVIPTLLFGILVSLAVMDAAPGRNVLYFLGLVFVAVFSFIFMKVTVFDLADEVFDAGSALVVRVGHDKQSIPLSEIVNVSYSPMMTPPRVVLDLRKVGKFGKRIAFAAQVSWIPFEKNLVIPGLIERINSARDRD